MHLVSYVPPWTPATLADAPSDTVAQRLRSALLGHERHAERVQYVRETVIGHLGLTDYPSTTPNDAPPRRLVELLLAVEVALTDRQGTGYESTRRTLAIDQAEVSWRRAPSGPAWDAAIAEAAGEAAGAVRLKVADLALLTEYLIAARELVGARDRDSRPGLGDILALCMTCIGIGRMLERYVTDVTDELLETYDVDGDGAEVDGSAGVDTIATELVRTAQWCSDAWSWLQGAGYGPYSLWDRGSMRGIRRIAAALDPDPRHRHPLPGTRAPVEVVLHDQIVVCGLMRRGQSFESGSWDRLPEHGAAWRRGSDGPAWILELFSSSYEQALVRLGWRQVPCEVLRAEYEAAMRAEEAAQAQASAEREAADEARRAEILAHPARAVAVEIAAREPALAAFNVALDLTHPTETEVWGARRWLREELVRDVEIALGWPGVSDTWGTYRDPDRAWITRHASSLRTASAAAAVPGYEADRTVIVAALTEIADRLEALAAMLPDPDPAPESHPNDRW